MKIEKISTDKVKITLSIEELALRKISPAEIKSNKTKAQDFFFQLLEESKLQDDFLDDGTQLFIEASTANNQFTITITKVLDLPTSECFNSISSQTIYRLNSSIYEFKSLENLISASKKIRDLNYYFGNNSLYVFNEIYYLAFSERTIKNLSFVNTFILLSEYCDKYFPKNSCMHLINEYGSCIIERKAVQELCLI